MEKTRVLQGVGVVIGHPDPIIVAFENAPAQPEPEREPECPVTAQDIVIAILAGKFRPMRDTDYMCYAGIEGSGGIWEEDERGLTVLVDVIPPDQARGEGAIETQVFVPRDAPMANPHCWRVNIASGHEEKIL